MKGKTASLRRTIRLAAGYQLQTGPRGNEQRLTSPKGSVQLNESAATILGMCNGKHTAEEIVARRLQRAEMWLLLEASLAAVTGPRDK